MTAHDLNLVREPSLWLIRKRAERANALCNTFKAAIRRLALAPDGLILIGDRLGRPEDGDTIRLQDARRLYQAGFARFSSTMEGHFLRLTDKGVATAVALAPEPQPRPQP